MCHAKLLRRAIQIRMSILVPITITLQPQILNAKGHKSLLKTQSDCLMRDSAKHSALVLWVHVRWGGRADHEEIKLMNRFSEESFLVRSFAFCISFVFEM